jgi:hypothetical protein
VKIIPVRFQGNCSFCGDLLDIRHDGVYQRTAGWVRRRHEGGGNAVALPERFFEYACAQCIDNAKHRNGAVQYTLFG